MSSAMAPAIQRLDEHEKQRTQKMSLLHAARDGDEPEVRRLLASEKLDVDLQDENGRTPLMLALAGLHDATVATILEFSPDIHLKSKSGESALQMAFELGLSGKSVVGMFLEVLQEECCDDAHELASKLTIVGCPLFLAALLQDSEVTRLMLRNGSAVDARDPVTLKTALHVAVGLKDYASVKVLVEGGADVNAMNSDGSIPIFDYRSRFHVSDEELLALSLLTDGCTTLTTPNKIAFFQVYPALRFANAEALRILVGSNIDWCATDFCRMTPLYYLARNEALVGHQDVLEGLRGKVIYDKARDRAPFRLLPFVSWHNVTKLLEMLLDSGADPNTRNPDGTSALIHVAKFEGDAEMLEENRRTFTLLLRRGADPQILSKSDRTVFDYIVKWKNYHLAEAAIGQLLVDQSLGRPMTEKVRDTINSDQTLKDQLLLCKKHLDKLKRSKVRLSLTLFEVLIASEKAMAGYARNEEFCDKMASYKFYSDNTHFDYIIRQKFKKTMESVRMRKATIDLVCKITNVCYDSYPMIVDKITDYVICK